MVSWARRCQVQSSRRGVRWLDGGARLGEARQRFSIISIITSASSSTMWPPSSASSQSAFSSRAFVSLPSLKPSWSESSWTHSSSRRIKSSSRELSHPQPIVINSAGILVDLVVLACHRRSAWRLLWTAGLEHHGIASHIRENENPATF